ncbi:MAG: histidine phosphatase family protein [Pseudomonadota bacterium]
MPYLYLIRHGQTDWNEKKIIMGKKDISLNQNGKTEINTIVKTINNVKFDALYCSPIKRAVESAELIAKKIKLTPTLCEPFTEIPLDMWEGEKAKKLMDTDVNFKLYWKSPEKAILSYGKSIKDFQKDVWKGVLDIQNKHPEGNICIVTHMDTIKIILCKTLGLNIKFLHRLKIQNGSLSILNCANDDSYLEVLNYKPARKF